MSLGLDHKSQRDRPLWGNKLVAALRTQSPIPYGSNEGPLRLTLRVAHSKSLGFTELLTGLRLETTPHPRPLPSIALAADDPPPSSPLGFGIFSVLAFFGI